VAASRRCHLSAVVVTAGATAVSTMTTINWSTVGVTACSSPAREKTCVLRPWPCVSRAGTTWTGRKVSQTDRWDSRHAEEIVAAVTHGGIRSRAVPGAPPGIHDFDVELPDGRVVAVGVTRHNIAGRLQVLAEIQKRT